MKTTSQQRDRDLVLEFLKARGFPATRQQIEDSWTCHQIRKPTLDRILETAGCLEAGIRRKVRDGVVVFYLIEFGEPPGDPVQDYDRGDGVFVDVPIGPAPVEHVEPPDPVETLRQTQDLVERLQSAPRKPATLYSPPDASEPDDFLGLAPVASPGVSPRILETVIDSKGFASVVKRSKWWRYV